MITAIRKVEEGNTEQTPAVFSCAHLETALDHAEPLTVLVRGERTATT
eukprot:COSAG06_NODE_30275_length_538_cov_1.674208_1_plen_47_part_01